MLRFATVAAGVLFLCGGCHHDGVGTSDLGGAGDLSGAIDLAGATDLPFAVDLAIFDAGPPIVAPPNQWTWVDLPNNFCDDGSPTGIAVNPGASDKLLVFFNGGGACGDYLSCYVLNTTNHGPFGATEFAAQSLPAGSIFDRTAAGNPFADYSMVFIPYCTGDAHGGVNVATYTAGPVSKVYHHVGHTNALHALDPISATWPTLSKLVISGASAGGYGAFFNYDSYRARWPSATSYLLDDSGPALEDSDTPSLLQSWFASWGLLDWMKVRCPACTVSPAALAPALAIAYPNDRLALLSSIQDQTIRAFYLMTASVFQDALTRLATDILDPIPHHHHFFVTGDTHTMLGHPQDFTAGTTGLWTWIGQLVGDDAAWTSVGP